MTDAEQIKSQVDIVDVISQFIELKKTGSSYSGNCPFHDEKTGSFNVDPSRQSFKCFGCQEQGDVIDFVTKHKNFDFKQAVEFLGGEIKPDRKPRKKQPRPKPAKPVPLKYEDAKNHYTKEVMQFRADGIFKDNPHEFKQAWAYKNDKGEVELVAARFEDKKGDKAVLSMYWNGKTIKLKNYPILLFNRDLLAANPDKPLLIVEGEKAAEAASVLTDFVTTTWNGGGAKVKDADWSILKGREVFIFPDDDQKKYLDGHPRAGQILPAAEQPGNKAAAAIKKKLPHAKTVKPVIKARKIKKSGADIVEVLQVMTVEEVTAHIMATESDNKSDPAPETATTTATDIPTPSAWPFQVLGVADDGKAYFIGQNDRLYDLNPLSLTQKQLYNLINIEWWRETYGYTGKDWEQAMSDLVQTSNATDFDPDRMRGRGAWREPDGRICYHDGRKTTGEYSSDRIYLRRSVKDIGLNCKPATTDQRHKICESVKELTFDTTADCVRTLGWSALAPFAGALPWRPAGLMTAASGTGKSTIVNLIIKPLAMPIICSGGESTSAGIRQRIGVDSCAIVVEEAETDTQKKKQNRDETFSLMRQSTSDDSPDVLKGTIDGRGLSFTLRSMFFFVSISPEVECEADENRIFRVNLIKAGYRRAVWLKKEKELKKYLTPEICAGVRAYTWQHLPEIIALAERVAIQAQLVAGADNRTAFAESLLLAAYMAVFKDKPKPDNDYINEFVKLFYEMGVPEKRRNENEEMVDLLLDAIVKGDSGHNYTIREVLKAIESGTVWSNADDIGDDGPREEMPMEKTYARRLAGMYGMGLAPDGNIAIAKNHQEVMKILNKGKGYQMQLMRHPRLVEKSRNIYMGSSAGTKNCVIIGWEDSE
jgi:putative DNA primase/helicase